MAGLAREAFEMCGDDEDGSSRFPVGAPSASIVLGRLEVGAHGFATNGSEAWTSPLNGLGAALCLAAAERCLAPLPPIRTAQFLFAGPAQGRMQVYPSVLFSSGALAIADVRLSADATPKTFATLGFGATPKGADAGPLPPADPLPVTEAPLAASPASRRLAQHYELRADPEDSAGRRAMWLRHRDRFAGADAASLLLLAEMAALASLPASVDAGEVRALGLTVDIVSDHLDSAGGWWRALCALGGTAAGYLSLTLEVRSAQGTPVLIGRYSLAV